MIDVPISMHISGISQHIWWHWRESAQSEVLWVPWTWRTVLALYAQEGFVLPCCSCAIILAAWSWLVSRKIRSLAVLPQGELTGEWIGIEVQPPTGSLSCPKLAAIGHGEIWPKNATYIHTYMHSLHWALHYITLQ